MIRYDKDAFGFRTLFRLHGSAVFKATLPAVLSTVMYILLVEFSDLEEDEDQIMDHPYAMGALIAAMSLLLSFRANFSYNRYWEAFTAVHQMHSKWMDVGMHLAAFHLQSDKYAKKRPPAFGEYPQITCLERERLRNEPTITDVEEKIDEIMTKRKGAGPRRSLRQIVHSKMGKSMKELTGLSRRSNESPSNRDESSHVSEESAVPSSSHNNDDSNFRTESSDNPTQERHRLSKFFGGIFKVGHQKAEETGEEEQKIEAEGSKLPVQIVTSTKKTKKAWEINQPPLLLQEGAHLLSLLSAVALSTLRNDLEEAESPLVTFTPGAPWPHVDPDAYGADVRKGWQRTTHRSRTVCAYLFGLTRTPAARTLYNAARPFRVIGGVSDAEIEVLQVARGPYAKVALCTMWLEEFISREHLNGGFGAIGAPIISRVFQFTSDGMIGYNQARKIAYIPFPFPHAQITVLFGFFAMFLIPILIISFTNNIAYGIVLNMLTVWAVVGVQEVALELENPFTNQPNDMPLNNFQAQYNEGLMQMFAGYPPDAYWEIAKEINDESEEADISSSFPPTIERLERMSNAMEKDPQNATEDEEGMQPSEGMQTYDENEEAGPANSSEHSARGLKVHFS